MTTDVTIENINLLEDSIGPLLLTHISEEEYPYDEKDVPHHATRYIRNMLSDAHNKKIRIVKINDYTFVYKYDEDYTLRNLLRVIVKHKDTIIVIYSENNMHLLETLKDNEYVSGAIKLLNDYGLDYVSINEEDPEVDWMEVDNF